MKLFIFERCEMSRVSDGLTGQMKCCAAQYKFIMILMPLKRTTKALLQKPMFQKMDLIEKMNKWFGIEKASVMVSFPKHWCYKNFISCSHSRGGFFKLTCQAAPTTGSEYFFESCSSCDKEH